MGLPLELNTTLLRERFVIRDLPSPNAQTNAPADGTAPAEEAETLTALSNRLVLPLRDANGDVSEVFIIRSRIMHAAVRMAAQILVSYKRSGPLLVRAEPFDFEEVWDRIRVPHDDIYFNHPWITVYSKKGLHFFSGDHHPFLDVIEKCDLKNPGNYDQAVLIAEETFKRMGRKVAISHSSNIGLVVNIKRHMGRCGLILRSPHKTTTFNLAVEKKNDEADVSPSACLNASAAFLEGIQLAVRIGINNEKIRQGAVEPYGTENKENISASKRLAELSREIKIFENNFAVHYRPERPDFPQLTHDAEMFQRQILQSAASAS